MQDKSTYLDGILGIDAVNPRKVLWHRDKFLQEIAPFGDPEQGIDQGR